MRQRRGQERPDAVATARDARRARSLPSGPVTHVVHDGASADQVLDPHGRAGDQPTGPGHGARRCGRVPVSGRPIVVVVPGTLASAAPL